MRKAIEIDNLSVEFQSKGELIKAINGLNLSIEQGTVFGFLGPNGAGKTTTMHVLLGFVSPTSGTAAIFGEDVSESIARQRIGYLPEQPDMYRFLTGRELLTCAGQLFGLKGSALKERVHNLLEETDIAKAADRKISTYSRGMMQRICMAQALINDPDLIILDEPTGGLDPFGRLAIREIISRLKSKGKTVFLSSHELSEVELVCDHLAVISDGSLVASGSRDQLIQPGQSLEKFFVTTINESRKNDQNKNNS